MARTFLLAVCLLARAPLWAQGPEAQRLSAETAFGAVPLPPAARLASRLKLEPPGPPRTCPGGLDFSGVTWPASLTAEDRQALQLALNISGSFEGGQGWANITGNFDGQGVSLGLLNQNLGQGSLQQMLRRLHRERPEVLAALVSEAHLKSLLAMLEAWQLAEGIEAAPGPLSTFDEPTERFLILAAAANQASVAWARANLYSGAHFEPTWKSELVALAASPAYVSLQIAAALELHDKALVYERLIEVRELRSYLMLFDVNVQNGGLYPEDLVEYDAYLQINRGASSAAKLEKLLVLRLRHVRTRFIEDVRSRKLAIIRGVGKVHGQRRDLPAQYCYDGAWPYR